MAKHKLRVGYVGTSIATYFASEYNQRERAIDGLTQLAEELDFELIAVHNEVMSEDAARQAAEFLADNEIDFLLLQIPQNQRVDSSYNFVDFPSG